MTVYAGIDPGLSGAIALIHTFKGFCEVIDVATEETNHETGRTRRQVNVVATKDRLVEAMHRHQFEGDRWMFVIERPFASPKLPPSTIAAQFDAFGALRALAHRFGIVEQIAPAQWKRYYRTGTDKDASREMASRLYPSAAHNLRRVKDHDRAEAILLAHYHLQQMDGGSKLPRLTDAELEQIPF